MASIFSILLPIFGLIFTGYACRRTALLGPTAASELNRFVAKLALPALLFHFMAEAHWSELYLPGFTAAFSLSSLIIFVCVLWWRRQQQSLADASIDAIAASYANTAYIGLPLCLMAFGESSMPAVTIASIWVVCVMFAIAIVLIEIGTQSATGLGPLLRKVGSALIRNPLVTAPAAGVAVATLGLHIPQGIVHYLDLLGAAAAPCALVSIGLFLADARGGASLRISLPLTLLKLVAAPLLAWLLALLFRLPPEQMVLAVVLAALPTGTGPFMLAELYKRQAQTASQTILFSTVGSLLTLTLVLLWLH